MSARNVKTLILGVGNLLLQDEGVGIHAIRALENMSLPENVEVIDAGTASLDMLDLIGTAAKLIVIDAVKWGAQPGTIYRFSADDIDEKHQPIISLHDIGLFDTLRIAELMGKKPTTTVIIGVEPKEIGWGEGLSSVVRRRLSQILDVVLAEVQNLDVC